MFSLEMYELASKLLKTFSDPKNMKNIKNIMVYFYGKIGKFLKILVFGCRLGGYHMISDSDLTETRCLVNPRCGLGFVGIT